MPATKFNMKEEAEENVINDKETRAQDVAHENSKIVLVEQWMKNGTNTITESSEGMLQHVPAKQRKYNDLEMVQNKDVNEQEIQKIALLFETINSGQMSIVEQLQNNDANVNVKSEADNLVLINTAGLVDERFITNLQRESDDTALLPAMYFGYMLHIPFNKIPDVNTHSEVRATLLMLAAYFGHMSIVETLLNNGADANAQSQNGNTPLMLAAFSGHTSIVKLLINKGATVNSKKKCGDTALHLAASAGHERIVEQLLDEGAYINSQTKDGDTPLMKAVSFGYISVVKILLQRGADVKLKRKCSITALFLAASCGQTSILELLLSKDPEINAEIEDGDTALMVATRFGHVSTVELVLNKGAKINARSEEGDTALMAASRFGHVPTAELLLNNGAEINAYSEDGDTALIDAACYGHTAIVQLLLDKGADMELQTKSGYSALHVAVIFERDSIVELLLNKGADMELQKKIGYTALHLAVIFERVCILELLLNRGANVDAKSHGGFKSLMKAYKNMSIVELQTNKRADVNAELQVGGAAQTKTPRSEYLYCVEFLLNKSADMELQRFGITALHIAVIFGQVSIVELLLKRGANVNAQDNSGFTPLMKAYKNVSIVELLINKGADVNARSKFGETPLMMQSRFGYLSAVELLLNKGAEVNAQTDKGETPLMKAAFSGNINIVELLLKKGANVKTQLKNYDDTALHVAARYGHTSIVKLILNYCAKVDSEKNILRSPSMLAAYHGLLPVLKSLLDKGANVNLQAVNGDTALHIAAWAGNDAIVHLLIKEGAEINLRDAAGRSPLYEAVRARKTSTAKLLLDNGADVNAPCINGTTPLHIAVRDKTSDLITLLIDKGANVMVRNKKGDTPLNHALIFGHDKQMVNLMRDSNIDDILSDSNLPKSKSQSMSADSSGALGQLYEINMLSLVYIRVLNHDQTENDIFLGANIDGIGAMDDICLRFWVKGEQKPVVLFMQLKHREDPEKGKLTDSSLWIDSGDFGLVKYFVSYLEIRKRFQVGNKDPMFEKEFADVDCYFVLYTPAKDNLSSAKKVTEYKNKKFDILINTKHNSKPFQYNYDDSDINRLVNIGANYLIKKNKNVLPQLDLSDCNAENAKDFFNRLWFYSSQAKQDGVERKIMEAISKYYNNESATKQFKLETHCKSIFIRSRENVQNWWKEKSKVSYLTRSNDFFRHAKQAYLDEVWMIIFNAINCLKIGLDVKFLQYTSSNKSYAPDAFNNILRRLFTMIDTENIVITVDKHVRNKVLNLLLCDNRLQNACNLYNNNFESRVSSNCQQNNVPFKYSKKAGTSEICGVFLRTKMMCLAFLRMLHHEEIKQDPSPVLVTKLCGIGVMNDICLRFRLKNKIKPTVLFLHLKHVDNSNLELTDEILWDESSDFSFQKHFVSFINIKERFLDRDIKKYSENKVSIFSGEICDINCYYGLYTPAKESIAKKKDNDNVSNVVLNIINTKKITKPFRYEFDETDVYFLSNSLVENDKGKLVNTFLEYLNNPKKYNSNLLTDRVIARYHVLMAQEVLRPCDEQPEINKHRLWQFRSEFFSNHQEHLVTLKDTFFKNVKSVNDRDALKSLKIKLPLSFGNLDMTFSESKIKAQKRINTLADELVCLLKLYKDTKYIEIFDDDIGPEKMIKQKTFNINGGIGSAVGNLLIYDEVTSKLKFNLQNKALPHNAAAVLKALKDDKHKPFNEHLSSYRINININGFPKTTFDDDKYEKIQAIDFLNKFWFFCDQAREADVECILKKEINEIYFNPNVRYSLNRRCNNSNFIFTSSHNEARKLWIQENEPYLNRTRDLFERADLEYISNQLQTVINYMYLFDIYNISIKIKQSNKEKSQRVGAVLEKIVLNFFKSFNPEFNKSIYFCSEYISESKFETSKLCLTIHPRMVWVALIMSQTFGNETFHVVARADPRGVIGEFRLDEFVTGNHRYRYRDCFEVNGENWHWLYNEEQPSLVNESLARSRISHQSIQELKSLIIDSINAIRWDCDTRQGIYSYLGINK